MRIKARIDRMRNDAAELRKATANIEHTRARRYAAGRESEFLPDAFACPELALDRMGIERSIEGAITFEHRVEEIEPGRRFPQAEACHFAKARARVDTYAVAPEINQKARLDPLDQ